MGVLGAPVKLSTVVLSVFLHAVSQHQASVVEASCSLGRM